MERDPETIISDDRAVRNLARELVFARDRGDDAAQDAWLAAVRGSADGREASLRAWLAGAVRRILWRGHRSEERRHVRETAAARREEEPSVADILEREAVRRRVVDAVVALPDPYRRAIILRFFEGLAPRDVAARMETPVETARTRIKRGIALLRSELDEEYGDAQWCIALVPFAVAPLAPSLASSSTGVSLVRNAFEGAVLMSTKIKAVTAILVVLSGAFALWWFGDHGPEESTLDSGAVAIDDVTDERRDGPARMARSPESTAAGSHATAEDAPAAGEETVDAPPAVDPWGRLEIAVVWADGRAAPDVPLRLLPFGVADPFFREIHPRTDRDGRVEIDEWPAGVSVLSSALGGLKRVRLEPGETAEVRLEIPEGLRVRGRVSDQNGQPVANAEVYVSDYGHPIRGGPIARTRGDGRFDIESVGDSLMLVTAMAKGHAPSPAAILGWAPGVERELELVLGGPGGALELILEDPDGESVPGARTVVGRSRLDQFQLPDGTQATHPPTLEERSDHEGRLRIEGLAPGPLPLAVRAAGLGPATAEVEIRAGVTTRHRMTLANPGVVHGRIVDADGEPAVRATVQIGRYGNFTSHYARTDADGRYRLEGVAAGVREITAETDEQGKASGTVTVLEGEIARWDARLEEGRKLSGVLVDSSSNPLAGYAVRIVSFSKGSLSSHFARTGVDGRFVFKNLDDRTYSLSIDAKGSAETLHSHPDPVKAGDEDVRVVVPVERLGAGALTGRVLGHDGSPIGGAHLNVLRPGQGSGIVYTTEAETGSFDAEKLPPGEYRVFVDAKDHGRARFGPFTVTDGNLADVGPLRLEEPGRLEVVLHRRPGTAGIVARLWARREDRSNEVIDIEGDRAVTHPLSPGLWRLTFEGPGLCTVQTEALVESGRVTPVELDVIPGRVIKIVATAAAETELETCTVVVTDGDGAEVYRSRRAAWQGRMTATLGLAEGVHTIVLTEEGESGRRGSHTVGAGESGDVEIVIE